MINREYHSSSFRDPSGFIQIEDGVIKRNINPIYFKQYESLKLSGFFDRLFKNDLLIHHKELSSSVDRIVIEPENIPFITYPYEWSFNQYKEAALLTLKLQKLCLENNYTLKDASAFNIAFHKGKAIFIDTLSFDFYKENSPWRAYKQFISHFLGPILLAHFHGSELLKLMSNFIDGVPVKMISSLLPFKTKLNSFIYTNIHLLAKYEDKYNENHKINTNIGSLSKKGQLNIIENLYNSIKKLKLKEDSEWGNYYDKTNYSDYAFNEKITIINKWVSNLKMKTILDVGGNDGTFIRNLTTNVEQALICDIDNNAIDSNYREVKKDGESYITPFVLDVLNPSAAIGFNNFERFSFLKRIKDYAPDFTFALALIHHISLSGNIPFSMSAEFFASFSKYMIIEFPKRNDSWVQQLLDNKRDFKRYFDFYTINNFEEAYLNYFDILDKIEIGDTSRVMYLMKTKHVQ